MPDDGGQPAAGDSPVGSGAPDREHLGLDDPRQGGSPQEIGTAAAERRDPLTSMTTRFNWVVRWFARRFFRHFDLDDDTVARLRELEARGAVVYVMRYASRLDYFLFNALFLREGLRLSSFANGIRFYYYRPVWEALRTIIKRPRGVAQDVEVVRAREYSHNLTVAGDSLFLFMRTASLRSQLKGRKGAIAEAKNERDLLAEVVNAAWSSNRPVHLVPLALFWRKGPRARRRFLNLSYGASNRPSDLAKVMAFFTTYRGLHVKVGDPIDLGSVIEARREAGPGPVAGVVRRAILTFLVREEKVVEGPVLQPRHRVQEIVMRDSEMSGAIDAYARERGVSTDQARARAEKMFREIAANMNSTLLAILNLLIGAVTRRLFASVEVSGLEKITDYAKRHPIVLVPSHRSYFDFVILSLLFYDNHIIPPHIAARDNMAFGPFGFIWRRAGAFFLRRSFDDPLYKTVFRTYVSYLIKEGFTQEFFIEGGRSRTGKTLAPRLGMLTWDVDAFLASGRRDLFFVPIAITYERLVEEGAMLGELAGEGKSEESVLALVRARKFLQRRFGSVFVNFGEPISLAEAMGTRRDHLARLDSPEATADRRAFVEHLGNRIVERINWAVVPSATSVAACALLGEGRRGLFRGELAARMQEVIDLLRLQDVRLTPALVRDEGDFTDSISSLLRMDLIRTARDPRGEILYFEESRRRALDLYRNSILHFVAAPSFLARQLLKDSTPVERLHRDLAEWLDLLYRELFANRAEILSAHFHGFIDHFERSGCIERSGGMLRTTEKGLDHLRFLARQTQALVEAYYTACLAAHGLERPLTAKEIQKAAAEQFERGALLGEVGCPEAANPVNFANSVDLLVRRGILVEAPAAEGGREKREVRYVRGPSFDDLPQLQARLAAALTSR